MIKVSRSCEYLNILYWLEFEPVTYNLNLLIFYTNTLQKNYKAEELHLILMKTRFFQVDKQRMLFEQVKKPLNGISMIWFIDIEHDIIKINNHKNIQFFWHYLINLFLEACRYIGKAKKHHLILKKTVFSLKNRFLLVSFTNSHPVVSIYQSELGK